MRERVLLHLAAVQGPRLDVLDVTPFDGLPVRELILHFEAEDSPASPAEVRAALQDLFDAKHVGSTGIDSSGGMMKSTSEVKVTCRGLVEARKLDASVGRPVKRVTFVTRRGEPMLNARFDTGDAERDASLNASVSAFAVTLVVAIVEPAEAHPLFAADCVPYVERLRLNGLRQVSGPSSAGGISREAIGKALQKVGPILNLTRRHLLEDKRRECYFLTGPLPEFRISAGDRWHCPDWESYRRYCWHIINEEPIAYDPHAQRRLFPGGFELPKPRRRLRGSSERKKSRLEDLAAHDSEGEVEGEGLAASEPEAESEE